MRIKSQLEKLGLTEKEATTYLAALEIGNGSVLDVAKEAGMAKSTVHDTVEELVKLGFLHKYMKGKRAYFTAADPKILIRKIEERSAIAEDILPDLNARYIKGDDRPRVQFYEGEWGVEKVLNQILSEAKSVLSIASPGENFTTLPEYFPWFPERRAKKGIKLRAIFDDSPMARERASHDKEHLRESRIIKTEKPFGTLTFIWQSKTAIITYRNHFSAIVIENTDIAESYRVMFEEMWRHSPRVSE
jgi:sugar-specific transcriptional regulator TrmB